MRLAKFFLFDSQDFGFFRSPAFLGTRYTLMLALPYEATEADPGNYALSTLEQGPPDPPILSAGKISELAADLLGKLDDEAQCKAIFDAREGPSEWNFLGMRCLRVDPDHPPREIVLARKLVENFLLLKAQERRVLAPAIPWGEMEPQRHREALARQSLRKFYDLSHPEISPIVADLDRKKKLLLHVCCGPDAAGVVEQLQSDYELTCFWYDPNIQPKEEYDLRLEAFLKVTRILKVETIVGDYEVKEFLDKISGLEASPEQGAKCTLCYDMRLEKSAELAKAQNFDLFSTTLAISPHKVQQKLKTLGQKLAEKHGVKYLAKNFMKDDGFKDSVEFTEEHDIYRQDYCGCWFSLHEGGPEARKKAGELGLTLDKIKSGNFALPEAPRETPSKS